jgi:predicted nucleotidyltransferase
MNQTNLINQISLYFESRPEVVAACLFGSYARSLEKQSSDIDLGVLVQYEAMTGKSDFREIYTIGLGRLLRKDLHIVIMNNAGEGILAQIFKHGKCIFQRDPGMFSRFKATRYSMIAEFGSYRRIMEEGFISKILGEVE